MVSTWLVLTSRACVSRPEETGPGPPGAGDDLEKDMEKSTQTWDALEWWLASIVVHAPNSPVAIVGTHDDCGGNSGWGGFGLDQKA